MEARFADAILVAHFAVVAFIVGGLPLVWVGAIRGWHWIRTPWLRYAHLAAIGIVATEALLGIACPLTVWEDLMRGGLRPDSFVGRGIRWLLFYEAPAWIFTLAYTLWAAASAATLYFIPCRRKAPDARG